MKKTSATDAYELDLSLLDAAARHPNVVKVIGADPDTGELAMTITPNPSKAGLEIRFPEKPAAAVLDRLKAAGWRWTKFGQCWYMRDTPFARTFAEELRRELGGAK